jgi:type II secretory pathway pseudopilin PulG
VPTFRTPNGMINPRRGVPGWRKPLRLGRRPQEGLTIVETAIALAILGLISTGAIHTLIILNRNAVNSRVIGNAREVVQRNIESAIGSPFTTLSPPANHILDLTTTASPFPHWDENGGTADITVFASRDGLEAPLTGTLVRSVLAEPNSIGADVRRVTFHLDYGNRPTQLRTIFNRPMSYEMTTIRATDK